MIYLHESMGLGRDRTGNPWICSQTRICCQTSYRLRYVAWFGPDLGPNCLQRLSAGDTIKQVVTIPFKEDNDHDCRYCHTQDHCHDGTNDNSYRGYWSKLIFPIWKHNTKQVLAFKQNWFTQEPKKKVLAYMEKMV